MTTKTRLLSVFLAGLVAISLRVPASADAFSIARIYIEYNASPDDLGFHVSLDGEDWNTLRIVNPNGTTIFEVEGKGAYEELGMTELFFEGAEPPLSEVPLGDLLALMPEGTYTFIGETVDGTELRSTATLSHAVPAGPVISAKVDDGDVQIRWRRVNSTPQGFPNRPIRIVGYQVIVGSFQVTLPASSTKVNLPKEFVKSLGRGEHDFEVLAIDASGNQTITEGAFELGRNDDD